MLCPLFTGKKCKLLPIPPWAETKDCGFKVQVRTTPVFMVRPVHQETPTNQQDSARRAFLLAKLMGGSSEGTNPAALPRNQEFQPKRPLVQVARWFFCSFWCFGHCTPCTDFVPHSISFFQSQFLPYALSSQDIKGKVYAIQLSLLLAYWSQG